MKQAIISIFIIMAFASTAIAEEIGFNGINWNANEQQVSANLKA